MPTLVSDLIQSSFRLIGAVASGETLETQEQTDAFATLNQSIAGRQRLTIAVGGGNSYVLSTRAVKVESASVSSGGIDSPLEIVDSAGWEQVPEKAMQSVYVKVLYCDYA